MRIKQITAISGKGGTGKTTFVSSLSVLMNNKVIADCDVDASNLHLITGSKILKKEKFVSGKKYSINREECIQCRRCITYCRYNAIDNSYTIDPFSCEHCGICEKICPVEAVVTQPREAGELYVSDTKYGKLIHAELYPGEENSGKLVTRVREEAMIYAKNENKNFILIDGPPGIGCPVIASITGVDIVIVITEPSMSGLHDLKRVLELTDYFRITPTVVINKYDINLENSKLIEEFCEKRNVEIIAKIPYTAEIVDSIVNGIPPILEIGEVIQQEFIRAFERVKNILKN